MIKELIFDVIVKQVVRKGIGNEELGEIMNSFVPDVLKEPLKPIVDMMIY